MNQLVRSILILAGLNLIFMNFASANSGAAIAEYRKLLQDGNPAELWDMKGEELWKTKRGPKNASLEKCDLGKGPGVVMGAYAEMPRYFADAGKVMDLEARLVFCMETLQGWDTKQYFNKDAFKDKGPGSDMAAIATYVAVQSNGMKFNVNLKDPVVAQARNTGEEAVPSILHVQHAILNQINASAYKCYLT